MKIINVINNLFCQLDNQFQLKKHLLKAKVKLCLAIFCLLANCLWYFALNLLFLQVELGSNCFQSLILLVFLQK